MSSDQRPVSLLVQAKWEVPPEGECSLFVRANNLDVVAEFQTLVQTALVRKPTETALGIAAAVNWQLYINSQPASELHVQTGPTCWAHATATVIHQATGRVYGREGGVPEFADIREVCFNEMTRGGVDARTSEQCVVDVLKAVLPLYRLRYEEVTEEGARQALNHRQAVIAVFYLFDHPPDSDRRRPEEWTRFASFFMQNPRGVLDISDVQWWSILQTLMGYPNRKLAGHVVALTDAGPGHLEFLNSWAPESFTPDGRFRIRNSFVLRDMKFYAVFWLEADLKPSEREAFQAENRARTERLRSEYKVLAEVLK